MAIPYIGYGHDLKVWPDIFSTLRATGYDGVISIEHEDGYMSVEAGPHFCIY